MYRRRRRVRDDTDQIFYSSSFANGIGVFFLLLVAAFQLQKYDSAGGFHVYAQILCAFYLICKIGDKL